MQEENISEIMARPESIGSASIKLTSEHNEGNSAAGGPSTSQKLFSWLMCCGAGNYICVSR